MHPANASHVVVGAAFRVQHLLFAQAISPHLGVTVTMCVLVTKASARPTSASLAMPPLARRMLLLFMSKWTICGGSVIKASQVQYVKINAKMSCVSSTIVLVASSIAHITTERYKCTCERNAL